jgi:hypothetical protein
MTPLAITVLNAASTLGETSMPYIVGLAFGSKRYWLLGALMSACMVLALLVGAWSCRMASRFRTKREAGLELEF